MLIGELPGYSTLVTKALVEGVSPFSAPTPGLVDVSEPWHRMVGPTGLGAR
jgi:hypothetical protein